MALRELIFWVAVSTEGVGRLEETLKWGEPAYVTVQSKSGSTVRIAGKKSLSHYAIYFHCQTDLVDTFRALLPAAGFKFEGNRAIVFHESDQVPIHELTVCIATALTYHRDKLRTLKSGIRLRKSPEPLKQQRK